MRMIEMFCREEGFQGAVFKNERAQVGSYRQKELI